ncbi:TPA: hypothetical protein ACX6RW_000832 [Photobacterium damselae]
MKVRTNIFVLITLIVSFISSLAKAGEPPPDGFKFGSAATLKEKIIEIDGKPNDWYHLKKYKPVITTVDNLGLTLYFLSYREDYVYQNGTSRPFSIEKFAYLIKQKKNHSKFSIDNAFLLTDYQDFLSKNQKYIKANDFQSIFKINSKNSRSTEVTAIDKNFKKIDNVLYPFSSKSYSDEHYNYVEISLSKSAIKYPQVKNPAYIDNHVTNPNYSVNHAVKCSNNQLSSLTEKPIECREYIDKIDAKPVVILYASNGLKIIASKSANACNPHCPGPNGWTEPPEIPLSISIGFTGQTGHIGATVAVTTNIEKTYLSSSIDTSANKDYGVSGSVVFYNTKNLDDIVNGESYSVSLDLPAKRPNLSGIYTTNIAKSYYGIGVSFSFGNESSSLFTVTASNGINNSNSSSNSGGSNSNGSGFNPNYGGHGDNHSGNNNSSGHSGGYNENSDGCNGCNTPWGGRSLQL